MDKHFGICGKIIGFPWDDVTEIIDYSPFTIKIHDAQMDIGFDEISQKNEAEILGKRLINSWSFVNNLKLSINFNQTWSRNEPGVNDIGLMLSDSVTADDRVQITRTHSFTVTANIVSEEQSDSASFLNSVDIFNKANSNPVLAKVMEYFNQDIVDSDHPLMGVYKALEAITHDLEDQYGEDGRSKLGLIADKSKAYVEQVMDSTQIERHDRPHRRVEDRLSMNECKERAKILIEAYIRDLN